MVTKYKKISKSGGLTIPADFRRDFNYVPGDAVDINMVDGKLIIAPHTPRCIFCGGVHKLGKYKGKDVCMECVTLLVREVGTDE